MEYQGRVVGFKRTVGAVADLTKLAPGEGGGFEPRNPLHFILKDKLNIRLVLFFCFYSAWRIRGSSAFRLYIINR